MRLKRVKEGKWTILAACKPRGDCPLLDDLTKLEGDLHRDQQKLLALLDRVSEYGIPKNTEKSRPIKSSDGLFEFREGRIRVLWFYGEHREIVCSHMFLKRTQATPATEIERAEQSLGAYLSAKEDDSLVIVD